MFSAATKTAVGADSGPQFYIRAIVTAQLVSNVTIPPATQANDLIVYIERGVGPVSIASGFSAAVSVSLAGSRGASISYKTATTADIGAVVSGMGGSALIKTMAVLYTDLQTPIYALVSASGVITDSNPAPITLSPVSVSGTAVVIGVYAQTLGTSAARTFTPAATTAVIAGAMETRILLNADTTCVIDMGDEGSANTLLGVFFSASED